MHISSDELWKIKGETYLKNMENKSYLTKARYWMQERQLKRMLMKVKNVKTILEVGCGYGRITKMLHDLWPQAQISAIDISWHQLNQAEKILKNRRNITFREISLFQLPSTPRYDLVIAVEVLMHIHPDEISEAVCILTLKSNRHIVNLDWYDPHGAKGSDFCYQHDYDELYREHKIYDIHTYDLNLPIFGSRQRIFHAMKS